MAAGSRHPRNDRRVRLRRRAEGLATRTPPIRPGIPPPGSCSTSGSSTGGGPKLRTYRVDSRGPAPSPARDPAAVRDDEPRLRAHATLHGVRDRPRRAARAALPARPQQLRRVAAVRPRQSDAGRSSSRGTAASPASRSASRSSTTTSTTPSRTARTWCSISSVTPTTTTSTVAFGTSARRRSTTPRQRSAACASQPHGAGRDRGHLCPMAASSRSTTGAARPGHRYAYMAGPAGRHIGYAFRCGAEGRPRPWQPRAAHDFGAGHVAGRADLRPALSRRRRGRRVAAVARLLGEASTAPGWWCSMRATSSPTPSRSRTCAITSRSGSTGRSPTASPHDRRGPPAQPVHPYPCGRTAVERTDVARVHDPSPRRLRGSHHDWSQDGQGASQMRARDPQGRQGVHRVDPSHRLAEERAGESRRAPAHPGRDVLGRRP